MSSVWAMTEPAARLIVAMLFNGLWQGGLIALAVWAILRVFPGANASTRYAAWSAALLAVLVVPLVTTLPRVSAEYATRAAIAAPAGARVAETPAKARAKVARNAVSPSSTLAPSVSAWSPPHLSVPAWIAVGLFALWGLAALASLVRLIVSLVQLESLKRDALPLGVEYRDLMSRWTGASKGSREIRLCVSHAIEVPVAVGLFDAMILLPQHLLDRLESDEIDQISLHELAHLRRADDWSNGLQRIAQALLFFNPAVAFIAHQMDLEREVACDDWVLALTGDVRPYAFCLTKMAEVTAWPHRALAAPGVFATRKNISIRIERLLAAKRAIGSALSPGASSAVLAALIAAFFVLRTVTPSIAYTSQPQVEQTVATTATSAPSPGEPVSKNAASPHRSASPAPTERPPSLIPGGPRIALAYAKIAKTESLPESFKISILPVARDAVRSVALATETAVRASGTAVRAMAAVHAPPALSVAAFYCLGCDMHGVSWPGRDMHGTTLTGANFSGADLHGANFAHANLTGIDLRNADLRNVSFAGADMEGCDLKGARLDGADFAGAQLTGCSIDIAKLSAAQAAQMLRACTGCSFRGADLRGRDLRGIELTGADLSGADLRGADLTRAKLTGIDFAGARLDGAKLDGASFTGCDFRDVDLRNVDLSHANLTGSSFSHAIMR